MPLTARVKSASKTDFLHGLGLVKDEVTTKQLYDLMKVQSSMPPRCLDHPQADGLVQREAISAFNIHMRGRRELLRPQYANSHPPYAANQFTDEAFNNTVLYIWNHASIPTRGWYDRASTPSGDNWIVAWMLYHICRYRDSRNSRAQSKDFHADDNLDDGEGAAHPEKSFALLVVLTSWVFQGRC